MMSCYKGRLYSRGNDQHKTISIPYNMDKSQKHNDKKNKASHRRIHTIWLHLCKIQSQAKQNYTHRDTLKCKGIITTKFK